MFLGFCLEGKLSILSSLFVAFTKYPQACQFTDDQKATSPSRAPPDVPVEAPVEAPVESPAEAPEVAPAEAPGSTSDATSDAPSAVSPAEAPVEAPAESPAESPAGVDDLYYLIDLCRALLAKVFYISVLRPCPPLE